MATKGINVWFDLMTTDVEGAKAFYTETIGWKTKQWENADPNMPYSMWMVGESSLGGVGKLPEEAAKMGAPPHWLAYTTVDDVDAAAGQAEKLGGRVLRPAFDVPEVGRIAILADPQGATFAVFTPKDEMPAPDRTKTGSISWAELNTTDYEAAWKFYSELFGWEHRSSMDMGDGNTYFMFKDPTESTTGGMSNAAKTMGFPAHWLYYANVEDMDGAVARIKANGGKIVNGPMQVPENDMVAQCQDPQGAMFAIFMAGKKS